MMLCPKCNKSSLPLNYECLNCGAKFHQRSSSTDVLVQLFAVVFLLLVVGGGILAVVEAMSYKH